MPSNTFLNLSEEKQKKLLDAAKKEFSLHLLEDVSINQIIKNAGISRGSFYMYFEDKEDLYSYFLKYYHGILHERVFVHLENTNGDIIKTWKLIFEETTLYCLKPENRPFFKNVFTNLRFSAEKNLEVRPTVIKEGEMKEKLLHYMNRDLYNFKSDDEAVECFKLVMMITNMALVHTLVNPDQAEVAKQQYLQKLHMLTYGIYQREEK